MAAEGTTTRAAGSVTQLLEMNVGTIDYAIRLNGTPWTFDRFAEALVNAFLSRRSDTQPATSFGSRWRTGTRPYRRTVRRSARFARTLIYPLLAALHELSQFHDSQCRYAGRLSSRGLAGSIPETWTSKHIRCDLVEAVRGATLADLLQPLVSHSDERRCRRSRRRTAGALAARH